MRHGAYPGWMAVGLATSVAIGLSAEPRQPDEAGQTPHGRAGAEADAGGTIALPVRLEENASLLFRTQVHRLGPAEGSGEPVLVAPDLAESEVERLFADLEEEVALEEGLDWVLSVQESEGDTIRLLATVGVSSRFVGDEGRKRLRAYGEMAAGRATEEPPDVKGAFPQTFAAGVSPDGRVEEIEAIARPRPSAEETLLLIPEKDAGAVLTAILGGGLHGEPLEVGGTYRLGGSDPATASGKEAAGGASALGPLAEVETLSSAALRLANLWEIEGTKLARFTIARDGARARSIGEARYRVDDGLLDLLAARLPADASSRAPEEGQWLTIHRLDLPETTRDESSILGEKGTPFPADLEIDEPPEER